MFMKGMVRFMNKLREKMMHFMIGRYGTDHFTRFLMGVTFVCIALSLFSRRNLFYYLGMILLIYSYFRILSKNHAARYKENQKYLRYELLVKNTWKAQMEKRKQSKLYHIYHCPDCKQKIRIPRGKGKIAITCPSCHTEFYKRS